MWLGAAQAGGMPLLVPLALALIVTLTASTPTPPRPTGTWPLDGTHQVVRGFDPPAAPWASGHRGVDLLGSPGQEVRAARAGTVTFAGMLAGRGVVVVDHGGRRTTYEPVAAAVAVGEQVRAGAVLGHLQLAMSHCFPRACLHWGLIEGDTYLDPLTLVGGGPIRLLPLTGAGPAAGGNRPVTGRTPGRSARPLVAGPAPAPWAPLALVLRPAGAPVGTPPAAVPW